MDKFGNEIDDTASGFGNEMDKFGNEIDDTASDFGNEMEQIGEMYEEDNLYDVDNENDQQESKLVKKMGDMKKFFVLLVRLLISCFAISAIGITIISFIEGIKGFDSSTDSSNPLTSIIDTFGRIMNTPFTDLKGLGEEILNSYKDSSVMHLGLKDTKIFENVNQQRDTVESNDDVGSCQKLSTPYIVFILGYLMFTSIFFKLDKNFVPFVPNVSWLILILMLFIKPLFTFFSTVLATTAAGVAQPVYNIIGGLIDSYNHHAGQASKLMTRDEWVDCNSDEDKNDSFMQSILKIFGLGDDEDASKEKQNKPTVQQVQPTEQPGVNMVGGDKDKCKVESYTKYDFSEFHEKDSPMADHYRSIFDILTFWKPNDKDWGSDGMFFKRTQGYGSYMLAGFFIMCAMIFLSLGGAMFDGTMKGGRALYTIFFTLGSVFYLMFSAIVHLGFSPLTIIGLVPLVIIFAILGNITSVLSLFLIFRSYAITLKEGFSKLLKTNMSGHIKMLRLFAAIFSTSLIFVLVPNLAWISIKKKYINTNLEVLTITLASVLLIFSLIVGLLPGNFVGSLNSYTFGLSDLFKTIFNGSKGE